MTVEELITKLQEMPQDKEVYADGCDCCNVVDGVTTFSDGDVRLTVTLA